MTPDEFLSARKRLGLTQEQLTEALHCDAMGEARRPARGPLETGGLNDEKSMADPLCIGCLSGRW